MSNLITSAPTFQATTNVVAEPVSQPAPPASPLRLHVAYNIAWRSGKGGRSLDEARAAVRRFLRGEPDESFDPQLPSELIAAWRRGQSMLRSAEEHCGRYQKSAEPRKDAARCKFLEEDDDEEEEDDEDEKEDEETEAAGRGSSLYEKEGATPWEAGYSGTIPKAIRSWSGKSH